MKVENGKAFDATMGGETHRVGTATLGETLYLAVRRGAPAAVGDVWTVEGANVRVTAVERIGRQGHRLTTEPVEGAA